MINKQYYLYPNRYKSLWLVAVFIFLYICIMKQFRDTQYYVTDKQEIYNVTTKRYVKPYFASNGKNPNKKYLAVGLYIKGKRKNILYHRLIAEIYILNPLNLPQINHIDGNIYNNSISNLEWCNASVNNNHAIRSGLRPTKLNIEKANKIRLLLNNGYTINEICKTYNVGRNIISKIKNNVSWKI